MHWLFNTLLSSQETNAHPNHSAFAVRPRGFVLLPFPSCSFSLPGRSSTVKFGPGGSFRAPLVVQCRVALNFQEKDLQAGHFAAQNLPVDFSWRLCSATVSGALLVQAYLAAPGGCHRGRNPRAEPPRPTRSAHPTQADQIVLTLGCPASRPTRPPRRPRFRPVPRGQRESYAMADPGVKPGSRVGAHNRCGAPTRAAQLPVSTPAQPQMTTNSSNARAPTLMAIATVLPGDSTCWWPMAPPMYAHHGAA